MLSDKMKAILLQTYDRNIVGFDKDADGKITIGLIDILFMLAKNEGFEKVYLYLFEGCFGSTIFCEYKEKSVQKDKIEAESVTENSDAVISYFKDSLKGFTPCGTDKLILVADAPYSEFNLAHNKAIFGAY